MKGTLLCFVIIIGAAIARMIFIHRIKKFLRIETKDGIEEERYIEAGGIKQYVNIRGKHRSNPVLLVVHGGMVMTPILHTYQTMWESYYTVVNWDRRGHGNTYAYHKRRAKELQKTISTEQLLRDMDDVVEYLRHRFKTDQILVLADSQGTTFAPRYVLSHPEKVSAYIGSAQVNQIAMNLAACKKDLLSYAAKAKKEKDVRNIKKIKLGSTNFTSFLKAQQQIDKYAQKYITGSTWKSMIATIASGLISPYFKLGNLSYYMKAVEYNHAIMKDTIALDLKKYGQTFQVPMIFLTGERDWITRYTIENYYEQIQAPKKRLYYIKDAGHDALQEKPAVFFEQMQQAIHT